MNWQTNARRKSLKSSIWGGAIGWQNVGNRRESSWVTRGCTQSRRHDPAQLSVLMLYKAPFNLLPNPGFSGVQASHQMYSLAGGSAGLGCPLSGLCSSQWARSPKSLRQRGPVNPGHLSGVVGLTASMRTPHHARPCPLGLPLLALPGVKGSWTNARGTFGKNPPSRQEGKRSMWLFWQNLENK